MSDAHPHALTPEQQERYGRDGYLLLRQVVPAETVDRLRRRFMSVVDRFAEEWHAEGLIDDLHDEEDFAHRWAILRAKLPSKVTAVWRSVLVSQEVYGLWQEPAILGPVRSIVGDEVYANGIWNGRPREPGSWDVQRVTWHQDAAYYPEWDPTDGPLVTCWTPLVPVDERSGCLQVVPGSHERGYVPFERSENGIRAVPQQYLAGVDNPFSAVMNPGDLLMFQPTILHQALDNRSDYTRWSIDLRFGPATPEIIAKSGGGYYCFSASAPALVESFDTWAARYEKERAEEAAEAELEARARALGVSKLELEAF